MTYDYKDSYTLSTGRTFYANHGLIGLSMDHSPIEVAEGYNGFVRESDWTWQEKVELAEYMIIQWKNYRFLNTPDALDGAR